MHKMVSPDVNFEKLSTMERILDHGHLLCLIRSSNYGHHGPKSCSKMPNTDVECTQDFANSPSGNAKQLCGSKSFDHVMSGQSPLKPGLPVCSVYLLIVDKSNHWLTCSPQCRFKFY